jgi:hypothetical protein
MCDAATVSYSSPVCFLHAWGFLSLPQDTTFSSTVTALFLRPIFKILGETRNVRARWEFDSDEAHRKQNARSPGQISLEKTRWLTLLGASLAVISSTALYINFGLSMVLGGAGKPFWANPYLNTMVFGINLDSALNDIGMLLACGVVKKITCESVQSSFSTAAACKVEPAAPPVFDSEAYNKPDSESSD